VRTSAFPFANVSGITPVTRTHVLPVLPEGANSLLPDASDFSPRHVEPGQRVTIVSGPLRGAEGTLIRVEPSGQVVIQLEGLGDGVSLRVGAALIVAVAR
jgi:transcription antitermination factor NusG